VNQGEKHPGKTGNQQASHPDAVAVGVEQFLCNNTWKRVPGCLCQRGNTNSEIVGNPNFGFQFPFHTGGLLSNFLNFIFHGPPGLSSVDFMIVLK
jgi:hypothetical protein